MKKFLLALLSAMMVFGFVACEEDDDNPRESSTQKTYLEVNAQGTYVEAVTVLFDERYRSKWEALLSSEVESDESDVDEEEEGEDEGDLFDDFKESVCSKVYGEEAIALAEDGASVECPYFLHGVSEFKIEGSCISGYDANGTQIFSNEYEYQSKNLFIEEDGETVTCYVYKSKTLNSGDFTYFVIMDRAEMEGTAEEGDVKSLYFRYGSDLAVDNLLYLNKGKYAYWRAVGIDKNLSEEDINDAIEKFYETVKNDEENAILNGNVNGTYAEGNDVIFSDEAEKIWKTLLSDMGKDDSVYDYIKAEFASEIYGQKAIDMIDSEEEIPTCSFFLNGLSKIEIEDNRIIGYDANGEVIFDNEYELQGKKSLVGYEDEDEKTAPCYLYKSVNEDSGIFTYFVFMEDEELVDNKLISFRYGSDVDADNLLDFTTGEYAYWLAGGINENITNDELYNLLEGMINSLDMDDDDDDVDVEDSDDSDE